MSNYPNPVLPLNSEIPDFWLPDYRGAIIPRDHLTMGAQAVLIMFICNHSPYVKHIREVIKKLASEYQTRGVNIAAINSNDITLSPQDCPEKMSEEAKLHNYPFYYLFDGTQEVAKAFGVVFMPHFFIFNKNGHLVYQGQMDESRPGNGVPVTGALLRDALNSVVKHKKIKTSQTDTFPGCAIKWHDDTLPAYVQEYQRYLSTKDKTSTDQELCCERYLERTKIV
ncbi:thioredoxin family protein [Chitinispirillales bacterium ANBcel5]|uniref:thioredoxin family protein n=1 Tax=Cellulosispirillum alkaliphilum TaxID=3039283 RepID=UPI002A57795F|nr:thioredoxin family protein [Chitinispirillales bacterium ANBcel5]